MVSLVRMKKDNIIYVFTNIVTFLFSVIISRIAGCRNYKAQISINLTYAH